VTSLGNKLKIQATGSGGNHENQGAPARKHEGFEGQRKKKSDHCNVTPANSTPREDRLNTLNKEISMYRRSTP